jgi:NADH-quinone oxidoreductase subunit F
VPTDEILRFPCNAVILAVGETVDLDFVKATGLKLKEGHKTLEVDEYTLETSRANFYAGGDLITGASNVSNAMGCGKRAARHVNQRLMGCDNFDALWPAFDYDMTVPQQPVESGRHKIREMRATDRARNFKEATLGLSTDEATEECARCLRCDVRADRA